MPEGLSHSWTCRLILQVLDVEVLALHRRLYGLTVKAGNFISTAKSSSCTCTGYSIYMQAFGTEAALGSADTAPEGSGLDPLQPALDPVHPAARAVFSLRTHRSSCTSVKNSTSFWT